jgi:thioesterase domain-containing protein
VTAKKSGRLVTLVRRGRRPACVMLPGTGGGLSMYLRLAGHLGTSYNVYGMLPAGVLPGDEPEDGIATMAGSVVDTLVEAGIEPELVFGWSFGGVLAFEVGHALAAAGPAPQLVIVDSSPLPRLSTPDEDEAIKDRLLAQLGPRPEPDVVERVVRTFTTQVAALSEHRAERRYDGRVLVQVCAPWDDETAVAALRRWRELAGDLTTGTLDAGHFEVFELPHLPRLISAIDDFLAGERRDR